MISKRTSRVYVTHADTAPGYWMIGVLWRVLATSVQTGNSLCLLDQLCSPGSGPTRHSHPQEEGLYVVSGRVTFNAGGTELVAGPGSFVTIPRNTEHSFLVDEEAQVINFYFPAGFDLWLMGSAVPAQRNELPPPGMPPPLDLMKTLSDEYSGLPMSSERSTSPNPDAAAVPAVVSRQTAENLWFDRGSWSVLADAASTGGSFSVFEVELPQGLASEPEIYDDTDMAYYVLDGDAELFADDEVHALRTGSFGFVPRSTVHGVRVLSETARLLRLHTTPGYERIVRASGTRADKAIMPPPDWRQDGAPPEHLRQIRSDIGLRTIKIPDDFRTNDAVAAVDPTRLPGANDA